MCSEPEVVEGELISDKEKISPILLSNPVFHDMLQDVECVSQKTDTNSWSVEKVRCLIKLYSEMRGSFDLPGVPKKVAWQMLADRMRSLGHAVTAYHCDNKWRSLKFRYRAVKEKRQKVGAPVQWPMYGLLEDIMEEELNHTVSSSQPSMHMGPSVPMEDNLPVEASQTEVCQGPGVTELTEMMEGSEEAEAADEAEAAEESQRTEVAEGTSPTASLPSVAHPSWPSNESHDPTLAPLWQRRQVQALIDLYRELRPKFGDSTVRKKQIWNALAERMKALGHNYTGIQCDDKWRSLKYRFKIARGRMLKTGQKAKWVFYRSFEELAKEDPSIISPSVSDHQSAAPSTAAAVTVGTLVASSPALPAVYLASPALSVPPGPPVWKSVPVTKASQPKCPPTTVLFPASTATSQPVTLGTVEPEKRGHNRPSANELHSPATVVGNQSERPGSVSPERQRDEPRPSTSSTEPIADIHKQIVEEQRIANSLQKERNQILRELNELLRQGLDRLKQ